MSREVQQRSTPQRGWGPITNAVDGVRHPNKELSVKANSRAGGSPGRRLRTLHLKEAAFELVTAVAIEEARATFPGDIDVSATLAVESEIKTSAYTSDEVWAIDQAQYAAGDGPCVKATSDGHVYDVPSTDEDTFFPVFSAACRERGISSALSLPLQVRKAPVGSLNFYAREAQRFGGPVREKARGLAREASLVLAQAQEAFRPDETAEQLQEALETRDIIGTAKGILMEREAVSIDEAFQMLVRVSQTRNVKLREIARQVVAQHGQA